MLSIWTNLKICRMVKSKNTGSHGKRIIHNPNLRLSMFDRIFDKAVDNVVSKSPYKQSDLNPPKQNKFGTALQQ